jgi:hypothetical protein
MADKKKTQAKSSKGKKNAATGQIRLAEHPKARHQIGLAKSWAGLGAFAFVAWSAYKGGAPFLDVASRALIWGIAAYVIVWALAVQVWRHLAIAEVRAVERRWREQRDAQEEQVRKLSKVLEENGMPTSGTGAMPPA